MCYVAKLSRIFIYREEPGAGSIITFFQFLFIAVEGFFFVSNCCQKLSKIPLKSYMVLVGLYFTVSVVNNLAFRFDIPLPLHMIFRAVRQGVIFDVCIYMHVKDWWLDCSVFCNSIIAMLHHFYWCTVL